MIKNISYIPFQRASGTPDYIGMDRGSGDIHVECSRSLDSFSDTLLLSGALPHGVLPDGSPLFPVFGFEKSSGKKVIFKYTLEHIIPLYGGPARGTAPAFVYEKANMKTVRRFTILSTMERYHIGSEEIQESVTEYVFQTHVGASTPLLEAYRHISSNFFFITM